MTAVADLAAELLTATFTHGEITSATRLGTLVSARGLTITSDTSIYTESDDWGGERPALDVTERITATVVDADGNVGTAVWHTSLADAITLLAADVTVPITF